eukprot:TRINITY_DN1881_c0_g1_i2.p1 TRINITY_DN1881_c0_g1~~TRINITY_DN1881_c0_g1_i2.p1  ORF type:complete len:1025 (-),score=324.32 TRINITY_DN1881_c0_g1_i2:1511-4555(-)
MVMVAVSFTLSKTSMNSASHQVDVMTRINEMRIKAAILEAEFVLLSNTIDDSDYGLAYEVMENRIVPAAKLCLELRDGLKNDISGDTKANDFFFTARYMASTLQGAAYEYTVASFSEVFDNCLHRAINFCEDYKDSVRNLTATSFLYNQDNRYVSDNLRNIIMPNFALLSEIEIQKTLNAVTSFDSILRILIPVLSSVGAVATIYIFYFFLKRLKAETRSLYQIMLSIPKEFLEMFVNSIGDNSSSHKKVKNSSKHDALGLTNLRRLEIKLKQVTAQGSTYFLVEMSVGMLAFAFLSTFLSINAYSILESSKSPLQVINYHTGQYCGLINLRGYSAALQNSLPSYYQTVVEGVNREFSDYVIAKHRSEDFEKEHLIDARSKDAKFLKFQRSCSSNIIGSCYGLETLDSTIEDNVRQLNGSGFMSVKSSSTERVIIESAFSFGLSSWHLSYQDIIVGIIESSFSSGNLVNLIVFIAAFPIMIFFFFKIFYTISTLTSNYSKLVSMLNFFPAQVLDSTHEVGKYLETGEVMTIPEKMELMLEQSRQKSEGILQAASDAIITFDKDSLEVDVFNSAASKMFGYSAAEVCGQSIQKIIPDSVLRAYITKDKVGRKFTFGKQAVEAEKEENGEEEEHVEEASDAFGLHKNGKEIPVTISVSQTMTGKKMQFVTFLRDIRAVKGYQQLIKNNETLLLKMLPKSIAEKIKHTIASRGADQIRIAKRHDSVSILFVDIDHFTNKTEGMEAQDVANFLNTIVSAWDQVVLKHGVEKIKTIGDIYMAVAGCPEPMKDHASRIIKCAQEMILILQDFNSVNGTDIHVRVGINSGPVVAGVIGKTKVMYDLWGASVNFASRMQSSGVNDMIQITSETHELVQGEFPFVSRGEIEVKGGIKLKSFLYSPLDPEGAEKFIVEGKISSAAPLPKKPQMHSQQNSKMRVKQSARPLKKDDDESEKKEEAKEKKEETKEKKEETKEKKEETKEKKEETKEKEKEEMKEEKKVEEKNVEEKEKEKESKEGEK